MDNSKCVILVPANFGVEARCDCALARVVLTRRRPFNGAPEAPVGPLEQLARLVELVRGSARREHRLGHPREASQQLLRCGPGLSLGTGGRHRSIKGNESPDRAGRDR